MLPVRRAVVIVSFVRVGVSRFFGASAHPPTYGGHRARALCASSLPDAYLARARACGLTACSCRLQGDGVTGGRARPFESLLRARATAAPAALPPFFLLLAILRILTLAMPMPHCPLATHTHVPRSHISASYSSCISHHTPSFVGFLSRPKPYALSFTVLLRTPSKRQ